MLAVRRTFGIFLVGCALLIPLGFSLYFTPHQESDQQHNPTNNQRTEERRPAPNGIVVSTALGFVTKHPNEIAAAISALAAIVIACFTGTLWNATKGLEKSTQKLWETAENQRLEAAESAERQFKITQDSIKLARDEFNSTHRPRIILREAITGSLMEGGPISVHFHLANVGETTGRIIRSSVKVQIVPRDVPLLLLHGSVENQYDLGEIVLGPGQAILLKFAGETPQWDNNRFSQKSYQSTNGVVLYRDATIHFFGQFIYIDQLLGIWRRTAFRRQLIPERQRFYRIPDEPDLDYSD
jgi:hypothetical protein